MSVDVTHILQENSEWDNTTNNRTDPASRESREGAARSASPRGHPAPASARVVGSLVHHLGDRARYDSPLVPALQPREIPEPAAERRTQLWVLARTG